MNAIGIVFPRPLPYGPVMRLQDEIVSARLAGQLTDTFLFLEHQPVITLGVRADPAHVLADPAALAARGIAVVQSGRGGDVTYHGPGQLVVYPILRLKPEEADAHAYVTRLEEAALRTAADFGVNAFRRHGKTGIWTPAGKLAAIGVRLRRWVTYHGLSLNVDPDLRAFDLIVPCGLRGEAVASLRGILGERTPAPAAVRERLAAHLAAVLRRPMELLPARSSRLDRALRGHLEAALPAQALEDDVHQHGKQGQPAHAGQQVAVHPRQRG